MKLLIDAQLSPSIALWINETFTDIQAVSVWQSGLRQASDHEIFHFAREHEYIIVTKDADFMLLQDQLGSPPMIIWITCGNTSNASLKSILSKTLLKGIHLLKSGEIMVEISDSQ